MTPKLKMLAAGLLLSCWFGLVLAGKVPASDFTTVLRDCLVGLGVFAAALTNPSGPTAPKE